MGREVNIFCAHLEFRGWKINRPMKVKLFYHAKYVIELQASAYFNKEREHYLLKSIFSWNGP